MKKVFVTGTDTDVGKTIVSAGLCLTWPAHYWKPIQSGYGLKLLDNTQKKKKTNRTNDDVSVKEPLTIKSTPCPIKTHSTESGSVKELLTIKSTPCIIKTDGEVISQYIPKSHIYPSSYTLKKPLSPNQAASLEGISIQMDKIKEPSCSAPLIIEGAGGVLVPFNNKQDMTDLMKKFDCPVIIVSRSGLGTLNHTFLTLSCLKAKKIPVLGVIMVGLHHPMNKSDIQKKAPVLLELPILQDLSIKNLKKHFQKLQPLMQAKQA